MKFIYKTELEWLMWREQTKADGFFIRDNKRFQVLYLGSDEGMEGYDFYEVGPGFAATKWQRQAIAGTVEEEMKIVDASQADRLFEWLNNIIEDADELQEEQAGIAVRVPE